MTLVFFFQYLAFLSCNFVRRLKILLKLCSSMSRQATQIEEKKRPRPAKRQEHTLAGLAVLGFMPLSEVFRSISSCLPETRMIDERQKKNKKTLNSPHWLLLQAKSIQVGCWVWKLPSGNMAKKSLIFRYSETTGIQ